MKELSIITISRGSYSKGKEIAEKTAECLGYQCLSREVLIEASKEFNIPEVKLVRALHDAPSILDRFTYGKEKYVAYFRAALLKSLQGDRVVFHGLGGHFFLKGIAHALKVRIIADMEDRVRWEMEREGISAKKARQILARDDEERRRWSRHLYGVDTADPSLYDLVIHIRKLSVDDAVAIICQTVRLGSFQTTAESQRALDDLVTAAEVRAALVDLKPDVQVICRNGVVRIGAGSSPIHGPDLPGRMAEAARAIPRVKEVEVKTTHLVNWSNAS